MIKFSDIQDAFFFVSSARYGLHTAVISRESGKSYWRSEEGDLDDIGENDLTSRDYIEIPHRNELGLGQELVFEFVEEHLPEDSEEVQRMFRSRGAYTKFKGLLEFKGLLQSWYDFEHAREEQALRNWCHDSELEVSA
jgi:hypothetical protein